MRIIGCLVGVVLVASSAQAQEITASRLNIYLAGGQAPITTFDIPIGQVVCGQPKAPMPSNVINPNEVRWDDPANPTTADCVWLDTGTGPLLALPFNPTVTYEGGLQFVNSIGAGQESARSNPFTRPGAAPTVTPAGLRIGRGGS